MHTTTRTLLAALCCAITTTAARADTARGIVYHDLNANGMRDPGEPGVERVRVSNGIDVVTTDADGRYRIGVTDDTIVFVIKPRGWMTRTDSLNMPRFYYIHKPAGSPDDGFLYKGVKPTGPLPESIDFPLVPRDEPDSFEAVFVGDPQPYNTEEVMFYANDVVSELVGTDADFCVSLGDLVGDDLDLFEPLNRVQSIAGVPWYNVYGNHDMNFMSPNDVHADETFERVYGPATYAYQWGPVHFIVLDDVVWKGFDGLNTSGKPRTGNYQGRLRDDQFEFIDNLLGTIPRDELVVLLMHIPIVSGGEQHRIDNRARLFEVLSSHPHTLSLSGHTHLQSHTYYGSDDGYTPREQTRHHHYNVATASGSWWNGAPDQRGIPHATMRCGAPNGYAIIRFEGNRYAVRFKAAGHCASYQMNIVVPETLPVGEARGHEVFVNFFAGCEHARLEMRLNDAGEWTTMRRTIAKDPSYARLAEEDTTGRRGRRLPNAAESAHLWSANLPGDLPQGTHTIRVRATDRYGQTHEAVRVVEVVE